MINDIFDFSAATAITADINTCEYSFTLGKSLTTLNLRLWIAETLVYKIEERNWDLWNEDFM